MMFSTKSEYGVRVMIALGRRRGQGPVSLAEIADSENLPLGYLEHLVAGLRKAELVTSTRGAHGGYELGRDPKKISMAEVVNALEGTVTPMQCFTEPATGRVLCNHDLEGYDHCATRLLWTRVQGGVMEALARDHARGARALRRARRCSQAQGREEDRCRQPTDGNVRRNRSLRPQARRSKWPS